MTADFLADIIPEIRRSVASPGYLEGMPEDRPNARPPSLLGSVSARKGGAPALLLEFKRVSPGSEQPRLPWTGPEQFLPLAESAGATALSCLACAPRFEGSPALVAALARRTRLPVLFKDIVVEPVQVDAARRAGASAILLIARLETEGRLSFPLASLARRAHSAGLEVLLELHGREDLKTAARVPAEVYGVNQRDLATLALRPEVAEATLREARHLRPMLIMSGIAGRADLERFLPFRPAGVLVGSSFARAKDPVAFARGLLGVRGEGP